MREGKGGSRRSRGDGGKRKGNGWLVGAEWRNEGRMGCGSVRGGEEWWWFLNVSMRWFRRSNVGTCGGAA